MLLHVDERVKAAAHHFRHGGQRHVAAGAFLHAGHYDLVLAFGQVQQDSLCGDEVRQAFAGNVGRNLGRECPRGREPLLEGM